MHNLCLVISFLSLKAANLITSLILITIVMGNQLSAAGINLTGNAYDVDTDQLVYTEQHSSTQKNNSKHNMHSIYQDANGNRLGQRRVVFDNDKVVEYMLRQKSINYTESIIRRANTIEISVNDSERIKQKTITVDNNHEVIIDAGFSTFIARNWDSLVSGQTLKFDFVSVSRLSIVGLQIRATEQTDDTVSFVMTASNPIIRMLITPIAIKYSMEDRQLSYYRGVSNLQDEKGDNYQVEIKY